MKEDLKRKSFKKVRFKKFLLLETGIEVKSCLYFSILLFFYFLYCIFQGRLDASILLMAEMVLTAYAMNYLQVYLLNNFDEAEQLDSGVMGRSLLCSALYAAFGHLLGWVDRNHMATVLFFLYMVLTYGCVFLIYKIRRDIDTVKLNRELAQFKNRRESEK